MATIPDNQEMINLIALRLRALEGTVLAQGELTRLGNRLILISGDLSRRKAATKAPVASDPMTPAKRSLILKIWRANPDWTQQAIAQAARVTAGRVSETISGKRR